MKVVNGLTACFASLAVLLLMGAFILNNFVYINKPIQAALNSSALIHADGGGQGTGIIFINGDKTFLWTCHHVITSNIQINMALNAKTNKYDTKIDIKPVKIAASIFSSEPREIGVINLWAKIIRYSEKDDVALLELPHGYFQQSVKFPTSRTFIPLAGSHIFHIGNFNGVDGEKSVSEGICGALGLDLDGDGILYDRVGINLQPGSSGGGVFEPSGCCIGIMARSINGKHYNQGLIVPYRRLQTIADALECDWALHNTPIPEDYLNVISHDRFEIPEDIQKILRNN